MKKISDFVKRVLKSFEPKLKPVPVPVRVQERKLQGR
jgi:predicted component of type VI protein secretion system